MYMNARMVFNPLISAWDAGIAHTEADDAYLASVFKWKGKTLKCINC